MDAKTLTAAELRDALGEPGTGEVHSHPSPQILIDAQRLAHRDAMQQLLDNAEARGDDTLRASEDREFRKHTAVLDQLAVYESELADGPAQRSASAFRRAGLAGVRVGREPVTYSEHGENSYFRDQVAFRALGDLEALGRLQRHGQEMDALIERDQYPQSREQRDLSRTDGAGGAFVPPLWLMDDYVPLARAGRPTVNIVSQMALPPGTDSLNIPKIATGTATAIQTADNQSVQETDLTDTSISCGVKTIAGQQDVAVQALEQSPVAFDRVIFNDLIADYAQKTDVQLLYGANSAGEVKGITLATGINTVGYVDTSPSVSELYPKLASAINAVHTGRYLPPTAIVMHPRRWTWILAALDSSGRPLVVPNSQGPNNAVGTFGDVVSEGVAGTLLGLPVVLDSNIITTDGTGTNQDQILVCRATDIFFWESPMRTRVLPEVGSGTLTTRLQLYSYIAATAERYPKSVTLLTGSGLSAPSL